MAIQFKRIQTTLSVLILISCQQLLAAGDQGGSSGGGHNYGLEAAAALRIVPVAIKWAASDLLTPEKMKEVETLVKADPLVMIVDQPISVLAAGVTQKSTAFSTSGKASRVILIYDQDWKKIRENRVEEIAFMTHEVAVLVGLESTGRYG
jgi:hypothetical protein